MTVVSDTSPLNYLVLVQADHVLPTLFGRVIVPPAVLGELRHPLAPLAVSAWAAAPPAWLDVQFPSQIDSTLSLGAGETEAISLALELAADIVLVDDIKARMAAAARRLTVAGTLGVIVAASSQGLISLQHVAGLLRQTNFRASLAVWQKLFGNVPPP